MDNFTISQLSQFSGIKPHTIRIWEQRYAALKPHRSKGNTRYYDGSQLRRLLNIVSLSSTGFKLSHLGAMSDNELFEMVQKHEANAARDNDFEYYVSQLLASGMSFDQFNFEKIFSHCLLRFGMLRTYIYVIYPLLTRIGMMWAANAIPAAHEHYISNLLKQKMFTAIDALPSTTNDSDTWLLFLPEDEFHELGLLFSNFLIRSRGNNVIYLGANVPFASIESTLQETRINKLLLFLVRGKLPENIEEYFDQLSKMAVSREIFVGAGRELASTVSVSGHFTWLHSVEDLEKVATTKPQFQQS